jgi:hypothetical protein
MPTIETIGRALDEIFSGRWWWRARRRLTGRRLVRALQSHGDKSMEARRATERYREMQFAVAYWRSAPSPIRQVIQKARHEGAKLEDLQLVVLNRDLRVRGNKVALRRSILARALSAALATIVTVHWTLMCAMTAAAPGPVWLKAAVLSALFCVYAVLYCGWSLYGYRPLAAIDRSGKAIDSACHHVTDGAVARMLPNEKTSEAASRRPRSR